MTSRSTDATEANTPARHHARPTISVASVLAIASQLVTFAVVAGGLAACGAHGGDNTPETLALDGSATDATPLDGSLLPDSSPLPDGSHDTPDTTAPDAGAFSGDEATDPLGSLPQGPAQLAALCARGHQDPVARAFCATPTPRVSSLDDLNRLLGLGFQPGNTANGQGGNPAFALLGTTLSVNVRHTNPAFPRAFIFTPPRSIGGQRSGVPARVPLPVQPNPRLVVEAFGRGDQFVELAAIDRTTDATLRFYLFRFQQACNATPEGCNNADLYSPRIESGFAGWSLYEDTDLAGTVVNCQSCHQFDGGARHLLMQQATYSWRDWMFSRISDSDMNSLEHAFRATHPNEAYAGIPAAAILPPGQYGNGGPEIFEGMVENNDVAGYGFPFQIDSQAIGREISSAYPGRTPTMNDPPSNSPTWRMYFDQAKSGHAIPPAYVDFTAASFPRMATAAAAYQSYMTGSLPASMLPDMSDVLVRDAPWRLMLVPEPGSTGRQILVEMCSRCHNSRQSPSLPQSPFNVDTLDTLPRAIRDLAIHRLNLPTTSAHHMPPYRFADLSDAERALVITELQR